MRHTAARLTLWAASLAVRLSNDGANAQIYKLEALPIPVNRSLHMLYTYYIYSHEDAPEKQHGDSWVKFHELSSHSTSTEYTDADLVDYKGVQLSLMKYEKFWELIDPHQFCCTMEDVEAHKCDFEDELLVKKEPGQRYSDVGVYIHTIPFPNAEPFHPKDVRKKVTETGVYILMFSNCGDVRDGVVSGSIAVKNPFGFLPGIEYHKMPFYGWLSMVYMGFAGGWMILSVRWWRELFNIQNCISGVLFLGLIECFLWFVYFNDWNASGIRGKFLFVLAILSSVMKSIFSYMLVLVASLGWGVTRPYLDKATTIRIQAVSVLYIALGVVREVVLSFRHSHSLPIAFVLLCLLPVSLLNGVIFYWVFTALSSLIQTLKDRGQTAKLLLFQRLWGILIFSLSVATIALLYQIFNLSRNITTRWMHQWLFTDGVSHILFLLVLASMMYLWAPHKYSQRYAYSQQVGTKGDDEDAPTVSTKDPVTWVDEADEEEGDDSFWSATKNKGASPAGNSPAPATIGVKSAAASVLKDAMAEMDKIGAADEIPEQKTD